MSHSPEDFEQLQRLLSLKRREQPPPGYFAHFSDKVLARIEAEGLVLRRSWWRRLWASLDTRPVVACGYGCLVAGLLVVGVSISQSVEPDSAFTTTMVANPWNVPLQPVVDPMAESVAFARPVMERSDSASSFTPVVSRNAPDSLFDVNLLKPRPASYNFR